MTGTRANTDMPATGAMSARIDIAQRLRIFDFDGSMDRLSRDVWDLLEPEIRSVSEAYWQQWLRCFWVYLLRQ